MPRQRWAPSSTAVLLAALCQTALLGACGGRAGAPSVRSVRSSRARSDDGCLATETRLGASCWNAAGTRWTVEAEGPGGIYRFELELMSANRVRSTDHAAAGPANDEWVQDGPLLRIFLSDRYVEYRARIDNGTVLLGEARNVRGQRWSFSARRVFADLACPPTEARFEGVCMTVAGTRWRLGEDEGAPLLRFASGGELQLDGVEGTAGQWTQEGTAIRFEIRADGPLGGTFEADLRDEDSLSFRRDGHTTTQPATRMESFPPVIRP